MLRSKKVWLSGAFGLLAASVGACGQPAEPDHAQVCLDESTLQRVDDHECEDEGGGGYVHSGGGRRRWAYIPSSHGYPAVGQPAASGTYSYTRPSAGSISTVKPAGLGGSSYGATSGS